MSRAALDADARLAALAQRLARRLRARGLTLATAESCTGGWLAKVLTDEPGASRWLLAGWVVYSNEAKSRELGVRAATLARHGAVSEATVRELAAQARRRAGTDLAVSISGIAGLRGSRARVYTSARTRPTAGIPPNRRRSAPVASANRRRTARRGPRGLLQILEHVLVQIGRAHV